MIERVFHPFTNWEDYAFGMYEKTCFMDEHSLMVDCEVLLKDPSWLYESMGWAVYQWSHAAEHNLTNLNRNRQAWLGQAACCFMHGAPEYITKMAWHNLTSEEQARANAVADEIIEHFETMYSRGALPWQKSPLKRTC